MHNGQPLHQEGALITWTVLMGPLHSAQGSGRFENWKICVTRQQLTYPYTYPYTFFKCLLHSFAHTMPIAGSPSGLGSLNFVRTTCVPHTDSPHQPVRAVLTKVLTEFESFLPVSFFIKSTLSSQVNIQKAYWVKKTKKQLKLGPECPFLKLVLLLNHPWWTRIFPYMLPK